MNLSSLKRDSQKIDPTNISCIIIPNKYLNSKWFVNYCFILVSIVTINMAVAILVFHEIKIFVIKDKRPEPCVW